MGSNKTWQVLIGVASHVGAWIETPASSVIVIVGEVASHVGAWIETIVLLIVMTVPQRRIPCGCVD